MGTLIDINVYKLIMVIRGHFGFGGDTGIKGECRDCKNKLYFVFYGD
jgi:hypothetical protein